MQNPQYQDTSKTSSTFQQSSGVSQGFTGTQRGVVSGPGILTPGQFEQTNLGGLQGQSNLDPRLQQGNLGLQQGSLGFQQGQSNLDPKFQQGNLGGFQQSNLGYQQGQSNLGQQGMGVMTGQNLTGRHHLTGGSGIGTITFRPIEGRFMKDKDLIGNMDPYCKFKIGWRTGKSSVAKGQGTHPTWAGDAIALKVKNHEFAKVTVKDKDKVTLNDRLGSGEIPLAQVIQQGKSVQWIQITNRKGEVTGEIQVEMIFTPDVSNTGNIAGNV